MKTKFCIAALLTFLSPVSTVIPETPFEGVSWVEAYGYSRCVRLTNGSTTVILEPNCGGRVIEYSLNGQNVLFVDPDQNGWTYTPAMKGIEPCGGRFDIGPERTAPSHPALWLGGWTAEIIGKRAARMTSVEDKVTGVQLTREFRLDNASSHLFCTQTITNISDSTKQYFHWSRTFAEGNGICIVPLTPGSRFPKGYIVYEPASGPKYMNFRPDDHSNIAIRDGYFVLSGPPSFPKFGFDSSAGWFAYLTRSDLLFVKKFPVYPDRAYGEMAALTISVWYYQDMRCELEPIGPRETLKPGESASFTEEWWLLPYRHPGDSKPVDLMNVAQFIKQNTQVPHKNQSRR